MAIDTTGLITVAEAAQRLKLSQEQVRRNLRDGKLRGQRIGNQWFIEEASLFRQSGDGLISEELLLRIERRRSRMGGMSNDELIELIRQTREGD